MDYVPALTIKVFPWGHLSRSKLEPLLAGKCGFKNDGVIETHIQIRTRCNKVSTPIGRSLSLFPDKLRNAS